MIYLDTHVLLWLHAGLLDRFTTRGRLLLEQNELLISPAVKLELQYLFEIGRITLAAPQIISDLDAQIALKVCDLSFDVVMNKRLQAHSSRPAIAA